MHARVDRPPFRRCVGITLIEMGGVLVVLNAGLFALLELERYRLSLSLYMLGVFVVLVASYGLLWIGISCFDFARQRIFDKYEADATWSLRDKLIMNSLGISLFIWFVASIVVVNRVAWLYARLCT